jgi:hypothetical protein
MDLGHLERVHDPLVPELVCDQTEDADPNEAEYPENDSHVSVDAVKTTDAITIQMPSAPAAASSIR